MRALLAVALLGCAAPAAVVNGAPAPAPASANPDVRLSRDAIVREVIARLDAGDVNGVLALADTQAAMARTFDCGGDADRDAALVRDRRRTDETLAIAAVRAKGTGISVVEIELGKSEPAKAGESKRGCVVRTDAVHERVRVKLLVGGAPQTMHIGLLRLGERYYVVSVPKGLGDLSEAMIKFEAFADRICACVDTTCIATTTEDYGREIATWAKEHAGNRAEAPSDESKARMEAATKKLTDCNSRFTTQANP